MVQTLFTEGSASTAKTGGGVLLINLVGLEQKPQMAPWRNTRREWTMHRKLLMCAGRQHTRTRGRTSSLCPAGQLHPERKTPCPVLERERHPAVLDARPETRCHKKYRTTDRWKAGGKPKMAG